MAQDNKKNLIIDAAQKRFSHFGVDKTTMNEIAEDLSLSKASLYYYFPDKLNLYAAVLEKIINEQKADDPTWLMEKNVQKAIFKFLDTRTESILKHYNLLQYLKTVGTAVPPELKIVFSAARSSDINIISSIISQAAKAQGLTLKQPKRIAELLIDCLEGIRHIAFAGKSNFFPDQNEFYELLKREKEIAAIFIKGIGF